MTQYMLYYNHSKGNSPTERKQKMKEYVFTELGYFTKNTCEKIKTALDGTTFMNFKISYSNCAGNCTLIVATDYEETETEIKNFFLACALQHII